MTKSWNSKDNTIYTLPAALNMYYIHAASIISMGLFNIYNHVISQTGGGGGGTNGTSGSSYTLVCAVFQPSRKGAVSCLSPLLFYYCLANGNTSNKCSTQAVNIKVDLSIWENENNTAHF